MYMYVYLLMCFTNQGTIMHACACAYRVHVHVYNMYTPCAPDTVHAQFCTCTVYMYVYTYSTHICSGPGLLTVSFLTLLTCKTLHLLWLNYCIQCTCTCTLVFVFRKCLFNLQYNVHVYSSDMYTHLVSFLWVYILFSATCVYLYPTLHYSYSVYTYILL